MGGECDLTDKEAMEGLGNALDGGNPEHVIWNTLDMLRFATGMGTDIGPAVRALGRTLDHPDKAIAFDAAEILLIAAWRNRQDIEPAEHYLIERLGDRREGIRESCAKALAVFHFHHNHFKRMDKLNQTHPEYAKMNGLLALAIRDGIAKAETPEPVLKVRAFAQAIGDEALAETVMRRMIELDCADCQLQQGFAARKAFRGPPTHGAACRRKEILKR